MGKLIHARLTPPYGTGELQLAAQQPGRFTYEGAGVDLG